MGDLKQEQIGNLSDPKLPYDYMNRETGTVPFDKSRAPFQWVSEVAYKNVHRIVARGYDTTELVEQGYGVVDILFVDFQARIPTIATCVPRAGFTWVTEKLKKESSVGIPLVTTNRINMPDTAEHVLSNLA